MADKEAKTFLNQQNVKNLLTKRWKIFDTMGTASTIGLHMVSGPLVGVGLGFLLDHFLEIGTPLKVACLLLGIAAGFLNVYRDTQQLIKKMDQEKAEQEKIKQNSQTETEEEQIVKQIQEK